MRLTCKGLFFALLVFCISLLYAQAPDTLWTRIYGYPLIDHANMVQELQNGGYVVIGTTMELTPYNNYAWLLRVDTLGDTLWTRKYAIGVYTFGSAIQQTSDGGYIITGKCSPSYGEYSDVYLMKTDSIGDTLWTRTYGGADPDVGTHVLETNDGGYIITAYTGEDFNHDVYVLRTDTSGDTLWTRTYGGPQDEYARCMDMASDHSYVIIGSTESFGAGQFDIWLLKIDDNGDTLWTRTYGGPGAERGTWIQRTADNGYIITGTNDDVYLIKTDSLGDTLWTRAYGGSYTDWGRAVYQTYDQGYVVTGYLVIQDPFDIDVYVLRFNAQGETLWTSTYGGPGQDHGASIQQTSDGGYIIAGAIEYGHPNLYLIKLASDMSIEEGSTEPEPYFYRTTLLFGPLQLPAGAKYRIFDIIGREVELQHMKPGIYFVEIDGQITRKVVKIR